MKAESVFRAFLHGRNMRHTPERRAILAEVFATHGHFDAEELFEKLHAKNSKISRASVYRTLPVLVEARLVSENPTPSGKRVYEYIFGHGHHDHMRCFSCGRIIEFADERLEKLQKKICDIHGFVSLSHTLIITGLCRRCAGRRRKRK